MGDTITNEVKEISKDVRKNYGVGAVLFLIAIIGFGYYIYKENVTLNEKYERSNTKIDTLNTRIMMLQLQLLKCNEELRYTSKSFPSKYKKK